MKSSILIGAVGLLGVMTSAAAAQDAELVRYQRATARGFARLEDQKAFERAFKGKTPEEARFAGQQLAARGALRLSADDLKRRAELVVAFTGRAGQSTCAKWASGTASGKDLIGMLVQLDSLELDTWVDLSLRATVAEVRQSPEAFTATQEDLTQLFVELPATMTEPDAERFQAVIANFENASPEDSCWFLRQLYISALALEPMSRDRALRTLVWVENQPG